MALYETPLDSYLCQKEKDNPFKVGFHTALHRGYIGSWEIRNKELHLVGIEGTLLDGTSASVQSLFPESTIGVPATWYTGVLRCPFGGIVRYVHSDWKSIFENDLLISVVEGKVTRIETRNNGIAAKPGEEIW